MSNCKEHFLATSFGPCPDCLFFCMLNTVASFISSVFLKASSILTYGVCCQNFLTDQFMFYRYGK